MPRKRHTAEEIVTKLRQVDVLISQGRPVAEAVRTIGVTEVTYYRWRSEYGGLKGDQVRRLKELEAENARLRRAVSDLTLDKMILAEAARGALSGISCVSGHDGSEGAPTCRDAKSRRYPTPSSTSCWRAPIRRRRSIRTVSSTA